MVGHFLLFFVSFGGLFVAYEEAVEELFGVFWSYVVFDYYCDVYCPGGWNGCVINVV